MQNITQEKMLRTAPKEYVHMENRVNNSIAMCELIHAQIGIVTEAGEFADTIKKSVIYNQDFDADNAKEELGDLLWYIELAARALDSSIDELRVDVVNKLRIRYPEKFTEELAKERLDKKQICKCCGSYFHTVNECPEDTGYISDRERV